MLCACHGDEGRRLTWPRWMWEGFIGKQKRTDSSHGGLLWMKMKSARDSCRLRGDQGEWRRVSTWKHQDRKGRWRETEGAVREAEGESGKCQEYQWDTQGPPILPPCPWHPALPSWSLPVQQGPDVVSQLTQHSIQSRHHQSAFAPVMKPRVILKYTPSIC